MDFTLKFKNSKFKIMQIADIQEDAVVNPDTIKLITLAIEREKPDLIVLTGDQVQGYSACYRKDAKSKVHSCISSFIAPIEESGTPFCMTFGNHDDDCKVSKQEQIEMYKQFSTFVYKDVASESDCGTYVLKIKNSDGTKDILGVYLIDSNKKEKDGAYSPVKKEQIEWYKKTRDAIKDENGDYLPSILFQHIPLPEYYDVIKRCSPFAKGAVEAYKNRKNQFYRLPDNAPKGSFMGESPATPVINNGQFEAIKEKGDIFAVFVGHDHNNSYYLNKDGIDLGYTQGAGYNTYGPGDKRGVRVFVFDENDVRGYETYTVTMGELCSDKPAKPFKEFIYKTMPTSVDAVLTFAKRAAVVGALGFAAYKIFKK